MSRVGRWAAGQAAATLAAPVTNRIADGVDYVQYGRQVAASIGTGGRGLRNASIRRGDRERAIVGGEFFHGGSDRRNALAQLGLDMQALEADLIAGAHPVTDAHWITVDVAPVLAEWRNFVARLAASSLAAYVVEWSVFEAWWQRIVRLRESARARGVVLESSEPLPLPKTVWQRGTTGAGSSLDVWITLGKTAVFGAIAVTGVAGFYGILRDLHGHVARKKP